MGCALGMLFVGCGGGTDVTADIQARLVGTYTWDVSVFGPGAKQVSYASPAGWWVIDSSADGGATWCRSWNTWVIQNPVSQDEFEIVNTVAYESSCKDAKAGEKATLKAQKTADSPLTFKLAAMQAGKDPSAWKWIPFKQCNADFNNLDVCGVTTGMGAPKQAP